MDPLGNMKHEVLATLFASKRRRISFHSNNKYYFAGNCPHKEAPAFTLEPASYMEVRSPENNSV